jgi:flagellar basal-body rod protein FlgF
MENSLYVGLSRQLVLQRSMSMIANNVANVNTSGYKAQNPIFKEFISKPQGAPEDLSMVYDSGQYLTSSSGPLQQTGAPYDVALEGPGFFGIQTPSGEIQYTRAGNFNVNATGELVTPSGFRVADTGGAAITIPDGTQQVKITENGQVIADGNAVGQIMVMEFENINNLRPEGNGLHTALVPGTPAVETTVRQGALEGSNVNSVSEMTRMIEVLRDYQSTMRMVNNEHERQRTAIQRLAQTS